MNFDQFPAPSTSKAITHTQPESSVTIVSNLPQHEASVGLSCCLSALAAVSHSHMTRCYSAACSPSQSSADVCIWRQWQCCLWLWAQLWLTMSLNHGNSLEQRVAAEPWLTRFSASTWRVLVSRQAAASLLPVCLSPTDFLEGLEYGLPGFKSQESHGKWK